MSILRPKFIALTACIIFFTAFSYAKFKGPDETPQYRTVYEVLTRPVDGEKVELIGRIVKKIGQNRYLFVDTDGTGEIPLIISNIVIMFHKDFSPHDVVTISAKINIKTSGQPELIVLSLDIA